MQKKSSSSLFTHLAFILIIFLFIGLIIDITLGEEIGDKCVNILSFLLLPTWILYTILYFYKKKSKTKLIKTDTQSTFNLQSPDLSYVDSLTTRGLEFEEFTVRLLSKNGFTNVRKTQGSGDYGVDVLAEKDGITYAIQCKCYSDKVGNKAVQEAYSGKNYYKCMVAAVLTNNYFTKAAIETAEANQVLLWDREKLKEFLKAYSSSEDKVSDNTKELFTSMLSEISYKIAYILSQCGTEHRIKEINPESNGILYEFYVNAIPDNSIEKTIANAVNSPNVYFCESDDPEILKLYLEYPESMRILYNSLMGIK